MRIIATLVYYHLLVARLAFGCALFVICWQTLPTVIDASFPGFNGVFGDAPHSQYPRRSIDDPQENEWWKTYYIALYGIFGLISQYQGLLLSSSGYYSKAIITNVNRYRAQFVGLFHVTIGIHHLLWAYTSLSTAFTTNNNNDNNNNNMIKWGRLQLDHLSQSLYVIAGMASVGAFWHGLQLLCRTSPITSKLSQALRHKVLLDTTFLMTLIEILGFYVVNTMMVLSEEEGSGEPQQLQYRNKTFEMILYDISFFAPIVLFLLDWLEQKEKNSSKKSKRD